MTTSERLRRLRKPHQRRPSANDLLRPIVSGETTRAEIEVLLGKPEHEDFFSREPECRTAVYYLTATTARRDRRLIVYYDQRAVVCHVTIFTESGGYGGAGHAPSCGPGGATRDLAALASPPPPTNLVSSIVLDVTTRDQVEDRLAKYRAVLFGRHSCNLSARYLFARGGARDILHLSVEYDWDGIVRHLSLCSNGCPCGWFCSACFVP